METVLTIGMLYIGLGAFLPLGQVIVSGIGKYVVWDKRTKLTYSAGAGGAAVVLSFIIFLVVGMSPSSFPILLAALTAIGKGGAAIASRQMGLDLTLEDVKGKYGHLYRIDKKEITDIVDDEFTKKLFRGGSRKGKKEKKATKKASKSGASKTTSGDDTDPGLRDAVEGFIEKERRRKTKK